MSEKKLIVIVGPTAAGKTSLSLKLAEKLKTEIVSADSRQFYKEMEAGTAKPTKEELNMLKHHFINSLSIQDDYSAGKYEKEALDCLHELFKTHTEVLLVGGSGLFVKAVCEGFDALPPGDKEVRDHYERILKEKGIAPLQTELKEKDPYYFETIDRQNPRRLIRALEVIKLTSKPYSELRQGTTFSKVLNFGKDNRGFKVIKVGLNLPKELLLKRIDQRVDDMLAMGWLEECERLFPLRHLNALKTVGYSELFDFMEGKIDWEATVRNIKTNTWHYAKRQLTWFRKDKEIKWFSPFENDEIVKYITT